MLSKEIRVINSLNFLNFYAKFGHLAFYTIADLKISLYVRVHIKILLWTFCIPNPKNSRVIYLPVKFIYQRNLRYTIFYMKTLLQDFHIYISVLFMLELDTRMLASTSFRYHYNVFHTDVFFYFTVLLVLLQPSRQLQVNNRNKTLQHCVKDVQS